MISRSRNMSAALPITVEPFGDWLKTSLLINDLPALISAGSLAGQKSAADKLRKLVRKNLKNQGVPGYGKWPELSPKYKKQKALDGYDANQKLYRTGLYYRSIKIWTNGTVYYVGVKKGITTSTGGKTLGYIAQILERGSSARNIKARPLWIPTFKQFGGNKRIKSLIVWHIGSLIYTKYGVRPKIY